MKLLAPEPGWTATADVIVVGSGIAGLTTALQARTFGLSVLIVTKSKVDEGSTKWAQGGIAAALGPGDTPDQHLKDTLVAGADLCDVEAVRVLVTEGPAAVRKLIERGAIFDTEDSGEISLTREGGHLRNRILHAGGDATGAEVSRALLAVEGFERRSLRRNASRYWRRKSRWSWSRARQGSCFSHWWARTSLCANHQPICIYW